MNEYRCPWYNNEKRMCEQLPDMLPTDCLGSRWYCNYFRYLREQAMETEARTPLANLLVREALYRATYLPRWVIALANDYEEKRDESKNQDPT